MLSLDSGETVEYVHVRAHSARVRAGERVRRGQVLCESGDAGFCPVPHLHIEAHAAPGHAAPSIPLAFEGGAAHGGGAARGDGAARGGGVGLVAPPVSASTAAVALSPTLAACHFVPSAGRWYDAHGEVAPLPARAPVIADAGLPSERGDGSSSSGWETVDDEDGEECRS